ncbi:Hypothetical protein, conserved [Pseudomonas putida BIRD-1]|nr:Hypothetical protein, conserved [Pseudomonas putida BIRD-1]
MVSVPPYIGLEPLVGRYYPAKCRRCGWVGSSEELTEDDAQCTRHVGDRLCLGDCDELERHDLLNIIQAMAQRPHPEPIAWMVGTAFWWTKEEAERDAKAMRSPVIAVGPIGDIGLAGEMLRRADRREGKWASLCAGRSNQIAELRAQLAEAQEVLKDCIEVGELDAETEWKARLVSKGRRLYVDDRALANSPESGSTIERGPWQHPHRSWSDRTSG